MKTAVVATKCFNDFQIISWHLMDMDITELIIPKNKHISSMLKRYAENYPNLPLHALDSNWCNNTTQHEDKYNVLLDNCDRLVVFWNGRHSGVAALIKEARMMGKEVSVVYSYPTKYSPLVQV